MIDGLLESQGIFITTKISNEESENQNPSYFEETFPLIRFCGMEHSM